MPTKIKTSESSFEGESVFESPIGRLILQTKGDSIVRLCPTDREARPVSTSLHQSVKTQLDEYFRGQRESFEFSLEPSGSFFQLEVWKKLLRISFGDWKTYGEIARLLKRPGSARAVGNAVGKNPILILIPCHRVLANGGRLGGFSAGEDKKRSLLSLESIRF